MTTVLISPAPAPDVDPPPLQASLQPPLQPSPQPSPQPSLQPWRRRQVWNRFTPPQLLLMALAGIAPLIATVAIVAASIGAISTETMIDIALAAGEEPGMLIFGAMFLASPVQWITGRSQVRVRKFLGVVFFLLALSNGAMFVVEEGVGAVLGSPFLIAGSVAVAGALPLFATSSHWSQRALGMRRWRLLHRLTYLVAVALLAHLLLMGEFSLGLILITLGLLARLSVIRRRLAGVAP